MSAEEMGEQQLEQPMEEKPSQMDDSDQPQWENAKVLISEPETPPSLTHCRRLPLEMESEIFTFLQLAIQQKFICGMGRGIHGLFRDKLLVKTKKVRNPKGNFWKVPSKAKATFSVNGLKFAAIKDDTHVWRTILMEKAFPISPELSRMDNFAGIIIYYFELTTHADYFHFGLSEGSIITMLGMSPNSYSFSRHCDSYNLSGVQHYFEGPTEAQWKRHDNVFGCGILLCPQNNMSMFCTLNGMLIGKQIPVPKPAVDRLYPTVTIRSSLSLEANFGEDPAKPFQYNIDTCPGLVFE